VWASVFTFTALLYLFVPLPCNVSTLFVFFFFFLNFIKSFSSVAGVGLCLGHSCSPGNWSVVVAACVRANRIVINVAKRENAHGKVFRPVSYTVTIIDMNTRYRPSVESIRSIRRPHLASALVRETGNACTSG